MIGGIDPPTGLEAESERESARASASERMGERKWGMSDRVEGERQQ